MEHVSTATELSAATALSVHVDGVMAGEQVSEQVRGTLGGPCDLAMLFISGEHIQNAQEIVAHVGRTIEPGAMITVTAEGVMGGDHEVERASGVSLFGATMPGTTIESFLFKDLPHARVEDPASLLRLGHAIGAREDLRSVLFFADPFSVPAGAVVQSLCAVPAAMPEVARVPVIGGMASGATSPGGNVLGMNHQLMRAGGVGVTIRGDVSVDTIVSQGCRPIGQPQVVTGARRNLILTLGNRPAMAVLRELVESMPEDNRKILAGGVLIGMVFDEYKSRFGRGDFLIRGIMGVEQSSGSIAVGDMVRVGQTVQFHVRDAQTATEDLELLLTGEAFKEPAAGAVCVTCNGRGKRLFGKAGHDSTRIARGLFPEVESPPLAGMFGAGEIGPVGDRSYLHGHSACVAIFRPGREAFDAG